MTEKSYIAIDLKSFYASVECVLRGRNPLTTNLVVADPTRTEKTICLAVSPSLKAYKIPGRARLFEVVQRVKEINSERRVRAGVKELIGSSDDSYDLEINPTLALGYIVAPPRMAMYMEYSTRIYDIYLRYVAPEDMHVYSVDEVFIDATAYLNTYKMTAYQLAMRMIKDVIDETGITATAGIGTNLFLAKVAMDIEAKHTEPDENGVRIAELDEMSFRRNLWAHEPITDFWRVGGGTARKLAKYGITTMGDIAKCSAGSDSDYYNEELLYKLFGINAEFLIDHAWGWEPCEIKDIKAYRPKSNSLSVGQVLKEPYETCRARIVLYEMADSLILDLVDKGLVTNQLVIYLGYDIDSVPENAGKSAKIKLEVDRYGRVVPKHSQGTTNVEKYTSSSKILLDAAMKLYDEIADPRFYVRRLNIAANNIIREKDVETEEPFVQMTIFSNTAAEEEKKKREEEEKNKEKNFQKAVIDIKKKYGKKALLRGLDFEDGATARERNAQIGGHKA